MVENLKKTITLDIFQIKLLGEAIIFLFTAKLLLLILPIKTVLNISSVPRGKWIDADMKLLRNIKWAVRNSDKLALWKNRCLVQSITGRWMLHRRNVRTELFFGVNFNSNKKLVAHAWLIADHFIIVEKNSDYLNLRCI